MIVCLYLFVFFFFQAEDGIRDRTVTGVQTCALPICDGGAHAGSGSKKRSNPGAGSIRDESASQNCSAACQARYHDDRYQVQYVVSVFRSEERRVGKEWRYWWWS